MQEYLERFLRYVAMRNTALGRGYGFYPGIDISFRPGGGWKLYASWNRSMRLPTFTDLWYKSPTQEGNTGLRPEKNSAFRLGADWQRGPFSASAKAYYNHGTDMIDWVMYTADDVYHATNFQLDNMGFNLAAGLDAGTNARAVDYAAFKEEQYDKLAALVREHVDMDYIYASLSRP